VISPPGLSNNRMLLTLVKVLSRIRIFLTVNMEGEIERKYSKLKIESLSIVKFLNVKSSAINELVGFI